ncbi:MAG: OmpA family protein [Rickettsiales bacterium]|jgi:outer membrane protein OmpA-like peptidoglycan-associated protein|nr:OmpA family protein [Rickettsiales bacterium]
MLKKMLMATVLIMPVAANAGVKVPDNLAGTAFFELGRSKLGTVAITMLKDFKKMRTAPKCENITLVGHGCTLGEDKLNMELGLKRAHAVRTELVKMGFSEERITVKSVGKSQPTYLWTWMLENVRYANPKYNRAVEIYIDGRKSWYDDFRCKQDI